MPASQVPEYFTATVQRRPAGKEPLKRQRSYRDLSHSQFVHAEADVDDDVEEGSEPEQDEEEGEDLPSGDDLAEFFGDLPEEAQIAICRTYANYLSARARAAGRSLPPPLHSRKRSK